MSSNILQATMQKRASELNGGATPSLAPAPVAAPALLGVAHPPQPGLSYTSPSNVLPLGRYAPGTAAANFIEHTTKITIRAKVFGAVQTFETQDIDSAGIIDGLKEIDSTVEFDTKFGGGGFGGGKKDNKRASVVMIQIRKFGADVTAQTAEGELISAGIWKDKIAEMLNPLPLSDGDKAKVAAGIEGKMNPALILLEGKGYEISYWERDKDGVKSFNVDQIIAPANQATNGTAAA